MILTISFMKMTLDYLKKSYERLILKYFKRCFE